ncbi:F-box domain-containing protein [Pochonia chlamydosporia 170]|uniref:F-box domain-containing protein n=1 Tax=Pochonia chlamydosporia 170 TaxID=1380566 RepID=A0A179FQH3_METCM|nr:F-box domain-containing protein [Pochonia chlamydosporia 170]OAQ67834.1 F-box domain-containing protein [Pochonia chlamydosporia 170]
MTPQLRTRTAQIHHNDKPCLSSITFRIPPDASHPPPIITLITYKPQVLTPTTKPTSPLLNLPPEILIQIFSQSPTSDAVILALTCKTLLSIATLCNLRVPTPQIHRQPWALFSTPGETSDYYGTSSCSCRHLNSILSRFRPRDAQSRPSRAWNLCVDCACYRPTRQAYWSRKLGLLSSQGWGMDRGDVWQASVKWFAAGVKVQCPTCRLVEDTMVEIADELDPMCTC